MTRTRVALRLGFVCLTLSSAIGQTQMELDQPSNAKALASGNALNVAHTQLLDGLPDARAKERPKAAARVDQIPRRGMRVRRRSIPRWEHGSRDLHRILQGVHGQAPRAYQGLSERHRGSMTPRACGAARRCFTLRVEVSLRSVLL